VIERIFDGFTLLLFLLGGWHSPPGRTCSGSGPHEQAHLEIVLAGLVLSARVSIGVLTAALAWLPTVWPAWPGAFESFAPACSS
jgi:hypothetical protein